MSENFVETLVKSAFFLIFNRSSLANAPIMKLGQLVQPVKWSLLVYSLLP